MTTIAFRRAGDPEMAQRLRELADKVENGDVREIAVVADDQGDHVFWGMANFDDRWRLLGALEFAKSKVFEA